MSADVSHDVHTVMFARLDGVEPLADEVGYEAAHSLMTATQDALAGHVAENGGELIETIGEEQLALFPTPDAAVNAALLMMPQVEGARPRCFSLGIGLQTGTVHRKPNGNVYGDTVNTAARVKALADPGRVLTTADAIHDMHPQTSSLARPFDRVKVKGKAAELKIFEIIWQPKDLNQTTIAPKMIDTGYLRNLSSDTLTLRFADRTIVVRDSMTPVSVGRGSHCEIHVESPAASRNHARIDHRRGKFVLIDESTNGTHLRRADGSDAVLRREEAVLTGQGVFCLGEAARRGNPWLISYQTE